MFDQKQEESRFDLEKELKGPNKTEKLKEFKELVNSRSEQLKKALREGSDKEEFNKAEILLHGYSSLLQVIEKIK